MPAGLAASSLLSVPLCARDTTFGALTLAREQAGRRYDDVDLALVGDLGRRLAMAMDNMELYRRAQRAVSIRDEVLAIVSHDLRSPLTSASVNADCLLLSPPLPVRMAWRSGSGHCESRTTCSE